MGTGVLDCFLERRSQALKIFGVVVYMRRKPEICATMADKHLFLA